MATSLPNPNSISTLPSIYYVDVHQAADKNNDGKVSKQELQNLKNYYDGIRFFQYDPEFAKRQEAVNVMLNNFDRFAGNRGQSRDTLRPQDFQMGEDDHIRVNEILAVAREDGNIQNITQNEVIRPTQPGPQPQPSFIDLFKKLFQMLLGIFK